MLKLIRVKSLADVDACAGPTGFLCSPNTKFIKSNGGFH